jgi:DNA-directed RNA polymerase subunit beta
MEIREFGKIGDHLPLPDLVEIQTRSYERYLQPNLEPDHRKNHGLEALLREVFPIQSFDQKLKLEYLGYEMGKPRYSPDECRKLRLTYGMPFRIWLRLMKESPIQEWVYLGELPIMMGGGEFIINGAERVIVSQLHRSPGVDFLLEAHTGERRLHSCRIIPERGSWIELDVSKKDVLTVRIDQSGKFPATTLLRAMNEKYSSDADLLRLFYPTQKVQFGSPTKEVLTREVTSLLQGLPYYHNVDEIPSKIREKRGVYFFFDETQSPKGTKGNVQRVVYIGKAVEGKEGIFGKRIANHFSGKCDESGSLAVHMGTAILKRGRKLSDKLVKLCANEENLQRFLRLWAEWSTKGTVPKGFHKGEEFEEERGDLENAVARELGDNHSFCCVEVPEKDIKEVEEGLIAQFAQHPMDQTWKDSDWLGKFSGNQKIVDSGLWNVQSLESDPIENLTKFKDSVQRTRHTLELTPLPADSEGTPGTLASIRGKHAVGDIVNTATGEVIVESGEIIEEAKAKAIKDAGVAEVEVITEMDDPLMLNTVQEDATVGHEEALLKIHARLRPGNPAKIDKARELFAEKFFDANRYRLGRVGRFRLNRKFGQKIEEDIMTLRPEDFINSILYIIRLRANDPTASIDDIDHLGNRRLRTIDELASDELRKGFLRLRRTVQERMSLKDPAEQTPRTLINSKTISSAIEYFFGRGELSQVVDQTNPLSQLTNERRLSALGPGGLNRKRASFEVRDVHISHYGRICPIETPEGTNIGLIASLSVYATVDPYGFLITPYRVMKNGKITEDIVYLRADEEENRWMAPADLPVDDKRNIIGAIVLARYNGEFMLVDTKKLEYMDISPKQMLGVSASLIPFLEHNDANRALMGSNMQRQAVPLLKPEPPIVATGMEKPVAQNSGMVVRAQRSGTVQFVDADRIIIESGGEESIYELRKFVGLNERTCLNQKPIVREGQSVRRGEIIADGAATKNGELSLGRNVLVGFMCWDGYNFEDAIILSEKLVKDDYYTSIHVEAFEVEIRETKLGREEFTRDIPNVSERALKNLDAEGIVRIGTFVNSGDILVGKVSPKSKSELSPEEKLLHAIFGRAGEDVKNDSLEVPSGVEGVVIAAYKFSRKAYLSDEKRREFEAEIAAVEREHNGKILEAIRELIEGLETIQGGKLVHAPTQETVAIKRGMSADDILAMEENFDIDEIEFASEAKTHKAKELYTRIQERIEGLKDDKDRALNHLKRGDELPTGVLEMVKVYIATRRTLSVGDKMAGRHGNKGVIAKIVPEEDMPFLADGTPIEILLNPLGVPSRMNVGQILETHLGWAAKVLGFQAVCPPFDGAKEPAIHDLLREAGLPADGKTVLYDGRTGEPFNQTVTVGYIYMVKLSHLVDDKVHARATGPYSLITQQPLGGKARFGGQRFGEMEVWALEAYGAAYVLQEMLTVKSDDVEGRTKIYESMVKGENVLEAGTPVSFEVLCNEIKGLGLNIQLEKRSVL